MVTIIFETHSTSLDNEAHLSSGWNDVALSPTGEKQAKELGERRRGEYFEAIFCSDLQRSYKTAEIAFGDKFPVIKDKRLRECDYGDMTRSSTSGVESNRIKYVKIPFPNGESYEQTTQRMKEFLEELKEKYDGPPDNGEASKKVLIIGHAATRFGLRNLIEGTSLEEIIKEHWVWQPGWEYKLD